MDDGSGSLIERVPCIEFLPKSVEAASRKCGHGQQVVLVPELKASWRVAAVGFRSIAMGTTSQQAGARSKSSQGNANPRREDNEELNAKVSTSGTGRGIDNEKIDYY